VVKRATRRRAHNCDHRRDAPLAGTIQAYHGAVHITVCDDGTGWPTNHHEPDLRNKVGDDVHQIDYTGKRQPAEWSNGVSGRPRRSPPMTNERSKTRMGRRRTSGRNVRGTAPLSNRRRPAPDTIKWLAGDWQPTGTCSRAGRGKDLYARLGAGDDTSILAKPGAGTVSDVVDGKGNGGFLSTTMASNGAKTFARAGVIDHSSQAAGSRRHFFFSLGDYRACVREGSRTNGETVRASPPRRRRGADTITLALN